MRDSITPPPLRLRHPPASESNALATLNSRRPAADTASTPGDLIEPTTPKSIAHSVSTMDAPTVDRTVSIEEVRGMLRRQSTRGKRRASSGAAKFPRPPVSTSNFPQPPPSTGIEYDPYSYASQQGPRSQQPTKLQTLPQRATPLQSHNGPPPSAPPKDSLTQWPQPPQSALSQIQPLGPTPPAQAQSRQAAPMALPVAPPAVSLQSSSPQSRSRSASQSQQQAAPKPTPINTSNLAPSPTEEPSRTRATSPVRNPFQINALRSQAQGAAPQLRRPVPGSGTGSPREMVQSPGAENGGGVVRPPRGDSLAGGNPGAGGA